MGDRFGPRRHVRGGAALSSPPRRLCALRVSAAARFAATRRAGRWCRAVYAARKWRAWPQPSRVSRREALGIFGSVTGPGAHRRARGRRAKSRRASPGMIFWVQSSPSPVVGHWRGVLRIDERRARRRADIVGSALVHRRGTPHGVGAMPPTPPAGASLHVAGALALAPSLRRSHRIRARNARHHAPYAPVSPQRSFSARKCGGIPALWSMYGVVFLLRNSCKRAGLDPLGTA